VKVGGDIAAAEGIDEDPGAIDAKSLPKAPGVLDRDFIKNHTTGIDELLADIDATSWDAIERPRVYPDQISSSSAISTPRRTGVIINYGMGITQHRHGTAMCNRLPIC